MNRALKGVLWTLGAYAGLQLAARIIRRRWPEAMPASLAWLRARPIGMQLADVPAIMHALELERGQHVLEMGAGLAPLTGAIAEAIHADGRIVAIDAEPEMLRRLAEQVGDLSNLTTQAADPRRLPCPDGGFDRVLMGSGLGTIPQPDRVIHEAFRVLKPHGRLVVAEDALDLDFLPERSVVDMALRAGFVLCTRQGGAWRYVLVFERPAAPNFLHAPHEEHRIETYG